MGRHVTSGKTNPLPWLAGYLLDCVTDPAMILDAEWRVLKVNPAFAGILDSACAEMENRLLGELRQRLPALAPLAEAHWAAFPADGRRTTFETTLEGPAFPHREILLQARKVNGDAGESSRIDARLMGASDSADRPAQGADAEIRYRRKDGSSFPVDLSSHHIPVGDREHHVAFVRDITERKRPRRP